MKGLSSTVTKNGLSNLVRGGATGAVAILLPRFLTRSLDPQHFAAWSLILQIAAYASYLDFGLQTAIARFIAQAVELEQKERQAKLVSTALILLSLAALIAFSLIAIVIWQFPRLFGGVPLDLLPEFRYGALMLSLSACLLLPLSTYTGVLIGMHRNEIPALAIGGSRLAGAFGVIIACHYTQSLVVLALCFGGPNLLGGLAQMVAVHGLLTHGRARLRYMSRVIGVELLHFCGGLTVWSFGMLIISGLDVTVVGHFQFSAVGFYSIASMLIVFFAGLSNAVLSALMAPVAALHARGQRERIQQIVFVATRLTLFANLCLTAAIFLWGSWVLRVWIGQAYADNALPILKILAFAQTLRLIGAPISIVLVGIGEQHRAIAPTICEALVNLLASVIGMRFFGPIGVAWGTLAGAAFGILWVLVRTMPSVAGVRVALGDFIVKALLPGAIPCLPLAMLLSIQGYLRPSAYWMSLGICMVLIVALERWSSKNFARSFVP
jgi:O-antigen/teichoic acid export membrane protein